MLYIEELSYRNIVSCIHCHLFSGVLGKRLIIPEQNNETFGPSMAA